MHRIRTWMTASHQNGICSILHQDERIRVYNMSTQVSVGISIGYHLHKEILTNLIGWLASILVNVMTTIRSITTSRPLKVITSKEKSFWRGINTRRRYHNFVRPSASSTIKDRQRLCFTLKSRSALPHWNYIFEVSRMLRLTLCTPWGSSNHWRTRPKWSKHISWYLVSTKWPDARKCWGRLPITAVSC